MIIENKFRGKDVLKRKGVATKLLIEYDGKGTDLIVDSKNKVLKIGEGSSNHLILTKFAVVDSVKLDVFFIRGGMVIDLKKGTIIIEDEEGIYKKVSKKSVSVVSEGLSELQWVDYEGLLKSAKVLVGHKYNIVDDLVAEEYVNNLAYNVNMSVGSKSVSEWGLTLKFVNFYTDLGLGEFEYKVNDVAPVVNAPKCIKKPKSSKNKDKIDDAIIDTIVGDDESEDEF